MVGHSLNRLHGMFFSDDLEMSKLWDIRDPRNRQIRGGLAVVIAGLWAAMLPRWQTLHLGPW